MLETRASWCAIGFLMASVGSLFSSTAGYAIEINDYLSQVEAEAKQMAISPITTKSSATAATLNVAERLPLGLQRQDFEKVLQEQFIGTYLFYQRLTAEHQQQIFKLYQQDNRVSTIREQTIELLSNGGRQ